MAEKLIFHAPYHLDVFGDTSVRLSPEAKEIIKGIAQKTKRSDAEIATEMILFAAEHVETVEPKRERRAKK